jgi:LacI family transcriptional regulator
LIPTIKDVARHAGVSTATVSRVFSRAGGVAGGTCERVQEAARKLGYTPNQTARSLITSKTCCIGILLPDLYGDFYSELIRGIDQAAQKEGYHLLLSSMHSEPAEMKAALKMMLGRVDGLVILSPHFKPHVLREWLPVRIPVVLINSPTMGIEFDTVNVDNFDAASKMVSHLIGLGHSRIAIIQGTTANFDAHERLRGYRSALFKAGIPTRAEYEFEGDFSEAAGYAAVTEMLKRFERPTAIFAANDAMAIGALKCLREQGLNVPGDIAVTGFDGIPMAAYASPSLTTVDVPISRLGAMAVERLVGLLKSKDHQKIRTQVPAELVIRESCGAHPYRPFDDSVIPNTSTQERS